MDEFGVFTESFGLKPQGKAAPMAALKSSTVNNSNSQSWNLGVVGSGTNSKPTSSFLGDQKKSYNINNSGGFDVFGGGSVKSNPTSFDIDSFFSGSNSSVSSSSATTVSYYDNDDIFGVNSSGSVTGDLFGSFGSSQTPMGDLLGDFVTAKSAPKSSSDNGSSFFSGVDLIPGFGTDRRKEESSTTHSTKSGFTSPEDPFTVLQSTSTSASKNAFASSDLFSDPLERTSKVNNPIGAKPPRLKSPPKTRVSNGDKVKSSGVSFIDGLEDFAMGSVQNNNNGRSTFSNNWATDQSGDLDSFFNVGPRSSSAPKSRTTTSDPIYDALNINSKNPKGTLAQVPLTTTSSTGIKKSSSSGGIFGDLPSMFGGTQIYGEFEEVEGETEERRNARIGRLQRTNDRVAKAVNDMNRREFQSQQEQEERHRIAEAMDVNIRSWAAGKEGNMRSLLSSLQNVLWAGCGWEAVSLTDLITSTSVKKVYRKATLCIHPDKVLQKGATLQQKYIAEKVFDILKEAWNKFNKEELR